MKYLCLVYCEEEKLHTLLESPQDSECEAYAKICAMAVALLLAKHWNPCTPRQLFG